VCSSAPWGQSLSVTENFAAALAATVPAFAIMFVAGRIINRDDERVRVFGVVIAVGGLLAVVAILVSPQFFRVGLLEGSAVQGGSMMMGIYFLILAMFFGSDWKKITNVAATSDDDWTRITMRLTNWMARPPWAILAFLGSGMVPLYATWVILYRLTDSVAAALALVGVQLLVVGYCYAQYRKALAANPAPAR
jgi:hypothetical protein